jgi:hypothetical protein
VLDSSGLVRSEKIVGREYTFQARYRDIVLGLRIVYIYDMLLDGIRISVSIATAEFKRESAMAPDCLHRAGRVPDGYEMPARREQGMGILLDSLGQWLQNSRSDAVAERPTVRPRCRNQPSAHVTTSGSAPRRCVRNMSGWPGDRDGASRCDSRPTVTLPCDYAFRSTPHGPATSREKRKRSEPIGLAADRLIDLARALLDQHQAPDPGREIRSGLAVPIVAAAVLGHRQPGRPGVACVLGAHPLDR